MTQPGGDCSNNVLEFRKASLLAPLGLADEGRGLRKIASLTLPSDTEHAGGLHATEGLAETLTRQRNDAIYWSGFLNGAAWGILLICIVGMMWWRP